jgi:hypothetical protein
MKKLHLLLAALHASALTFATVPVAVRAQDASEIRAYMDALAAGTPEALQQFLVRFPQSTLPGSELGAQIAASIGKPTGSIDAVTGAAPAVDAVTGAAPAEENGIY